MIAFFESIFKVLMTFFQVILSIFQGFWNLLTFLGRGISWLTQAVAFLPEFTRPAVLAVLGIMTIYLIINRGGADN